MRTIRRSRAAVVLLLASIPARAGIVAFERDGAIWLARTDGSGVERVARGQDPSVSPDGRTVAYTVTSEPGRPAGRHVALLDVATKASRPVPGIPGNDNHGPSFSPDGRSLLLSLYDGGDWQVAMVHVDGTGFRFVRRTAPGGRACYGPVWAAGGASFYCQDLEAIHEVDLEGRELWSVRLAALGMAAGFNSGNRIAPSPGGKTLLIDADVDEDVEMAGWDGPPTALLEIDIEKRTARRVTPRGMYAWGPAWISGAEIGFMLQRAGETAPSLVAMPLSGGIPRRLVENAWWPSFSRRE